MSTLAPLLRELRSRLRDDSVSGVAPTGVAGLTFFWIGEALAVQPRAQALLRGAALRGGDHPLQRRGLSPEARIIPDFD